MEEASLSNHQEVLQSIREKTIKHFEVKIPAGIANGVEVRPEFVVDDVPILFAPGWGETGRTTYRECINTVAKQDRVALSIDHLRVNPEFKKDSEFPAVELAKTDALMELLDTKGVEKTDVIAHSEGAINAMIAATLHPERFRNIVLVNPGGMIGKDSFGKLLLRFNKMLTTSGIRMMREPETREPLTTTAIEAGKYLLQNPKLALQEAAAIASTDIHDIIQDVRSHGIKVVVIQAVDDPLFSMQRVQEGLSREMVDGFYSVRGDHNEMTTYADVYTRLAIDALEKLQAASTR